MAIVKTDSVHYEGIASALRNLHAGEETYTPAEMAAYLATEGTELKPENIVSGATIFGVKGTMIPPPVPPPDVPDAETMDRMLLMDDKGNVTWGFMLKTPTTGWCQYGNFFLPEIPAVSGAAIIVHRSSTKVDLYVTSTSVGLHWGYQGAPYDVSICSTERSWSHWTYDSDSESWGDRETIENPNIYGNYFPMVQTYSKYVWCSHDIRVLKRNTAGVGSDDILTDEVGIYGSEAIPLAFAITGYNAATTEFRAVGWIRAAYHTTGDHAGEYTFDDFRTTPSGGWNYIDNVKWCTRESIEYLGNQIWPPMGDTDE